MRSLTLNGDSTRRPRLHAALWITLCFGGILGGCAHRDDSVRGAQPAAAISSGSVAPFAPVASAGMVIQTPTPATGLANAASQSQRTPSAVFATSARMASAPSPVPSPEVTGPAIFSVAATPSVVHSGDAVRWDVRTTADIVSVSAHVAVYSFAMVRHGSGHFGLTFTIPPNVPPIFHGKYTLDVVAKTASGAQADRTIALVFE